MTSKFGLLIGLALSIGCTSNSESTAEPADARSDTEPTLDVAFDVAQAPDTAADVPLDAKDTSDSAPDAAGPDGAGRDEDLGPPMFQPLALVYTANPIDSPELTEVTLQNLTADDHTLVGEFANVRNCVQDLKQGKQEALNFAGFTVGVTYCHPAHTALPGGDGTYRHLKPPTEAGVNDDKFSEVMMYHHIQEVHHYFSDVHGLTDLDYPLNALVNVSIHTELCDEWAAFGNALFTAEGVFDFGIDFGFNGPAIIFGQTLDKDFAYSTDVIHHEYVHAIIGEDKLGAGFADELGVNFEPVALNEAYADYFACTIACDPVIGNYALDDVAGLTVCGAPILGGGNHARDLTDDRRCPDDIAGEVHADGVIFGSALWAIRQALGAEKADAVILGALVDFTNNTDFEIAAAATVAEAVETLSETEAAQVEAIMSDKGLLGCDRRIPAALVGQHRPLRVLALGIVTEFDFAPQVAQIALDIPANAQLMTIAVQTDGPESFQGALKLGSDPVFYAYGVPGQTHDAGSVASFVDAGDDVWTANWSGACLSEGPATLALHNLGDDFKISSVTIAFSSEPSADPVTDCDD